MAAKVFYDNVLSTSKIAEFSAEHSVETEILLADYDPPVFKIVKNTMEHSVTQKYVTKNKLVVEGFIKLTVYYQPPEAEKLTVVTQRIPYQKQFDMPVEDTDINLINVTGSCQYINTRPQNPTRIDIRGAYLFNVKVYGQTGTKIVTAANGKAVCCNSRTVNSFYISGQNIRQFTVEDELDMEYEPDKIIRVNTYAPQSAVSTYQGKISAKGEIIADIYYTLPTGREIKKYTHTFLYNQVIDISDVKENHIAYVNITTPNVAISQNSDSKKYIAAVTVQIDAACFARQEIIAVADAFSCSCEYHTAEKELLADTNMHQVEKVLPLKLTAEAGRDSTVCHVILDVNPIKRYYEINKTAVKTKVAANVIVSNSQSEYECYTTEEDILLPWFENCGRYDEIYLQLSAGKTSFTQSADKVLIDAEILVRGFVIEKNQLKLMENFEENEENTVVVPEETLTVYFADKGERVFDIAKSHYASPDRIMAENELQTDIITDNQMIFIPVFEQ